MPTMSTMSAIAPATDEPPRQALAGVALHAPQHLSAVTAAPAGIVAHARDRGQRAEVAR